MAKKKEKKVVAVKKPKIGERYLFTFAGGKMIGTLDDRNEKLEEHYKEPWFWMKVKNRNQNQKIKNDREFIRYPISIYAIIRKAEDGEVWIER